MRRLLSAAAAAFVLTCPAAAALFPSFTQEPGIRLSSAAPQSVVDAGGGLFRMYFIRDGFHVMSASSTDKVAWTEDAGVRFSTGTTPAIDASSISACAVFPLNAGGF